jgi:hypothetical protein
MALYYIANGQEYYLENRMFLRKRVIYANEEPTTTDIIETIIDSGNSTLEQFMPSAEILEVLDSIPQSTVVDCFYPLNNDVEVSTTDNNYLLMRDRITDVSYTLDSNIDTQYTDNNYVTEYSQCHTNCISSFFVTYDLQ